MSFERDRIPLKNLLTPYKELNDGGKFEPVAVGRHGIRLRSEIYSKELAKDYSKNKVIRKNTLTIGMGSKQIDIGILSDDKIYSVSPAYKTFKIQGIDSNYLRYCLEACNDDMSRRFMIASCRQGKSVDLERLLEYSISVYDSDAQKDIVIELNQITEMIRNREAQLARLDTLVKAKFEEMFGDVTNASDNKWPFAKLSELGELNRGVSKARPRNSPDLLGGPYPLIQTGDVANAGLWIDSYNSTYSEKGLAQSRLWGRGTLCITIAANIAQTSILGFAACFPDSVVGFVPNNRTNVFFMHYWFKFFQKILEIQAPQVAQKNINLKILSSLQVVVPPHSLQKEFAAVVEEVDKSKAAIKKTIENLKTLYKARLQEYFA